MSLSQAIYFSHVWLTNLLNNIVNHFEPKLCTRHVLVSVVLLDIACIPGILSFVTSVLSNSRLRPRPRV